MRDPYAAAEPLRDSAAPFGPAASRPGSAEGAQDTEGTQDSARLRVVLREHPERVLVEVDGVLDYESEGRLRLALDAIASRPGQRVGVDLSRVGFLDSDGIGALLAIRGEVLARGGELAVTEVSPMVARLLRMTGLDEVLLPGTGG
ncbi:STAS domain-containing protein [Streptomyces sp. SPB074]|uniref:STAS domain-containing protein n=1 Tax=Streptomyces sp. (strain SPB074) TaxID=465543 RepID=UPI00017F1AFE|nr:STAS domain-containing protein [Streptomyces sp. SPB074]EDY43732.1 STAS domain-containing protein [Streptomyces sp. SPB074]